LIACAHLTSGRDVQPRPTGMISARVRPPQMSSRESLYLLRRECGGFRLSPARSRGAIGHMLSRGRATRRAAQGSVLRSLAPVEHTRALLPTWAQGSINFRHKHLGSHRLPGIMLVVLALGQHHGILFHFPVGKLPEEMIDAVEAGTLLVHRVHH